MKWLLVKHYIVVRLLRLQEFGLRYKWLGPALILLILLCSLGLQKLLSQTPEKTERAFYYGQINKLYSGIMEVQTLTADSDALRNVKVFGKYSQQMDSLISPCAKVTKRPRGSEKIPADLRKLTEKFSLLCEDVIKVASYQRKLYDRLELVIEFDTSSISDPSGAPFVKRLAAFREIVASSLYGIRQLDSKMVGDVGLTEIQNELQDLQGRAEEIEGDVEASKRDSSNLSALIKRAEAVQQDILVRRAYYWNSTVELAKLKEAVRRQIDYYQ